MGHFWVISFTKCDLRSCIETAYWVNLPQDGASTRGLAPLSERWQHISTNSHETEKALHDTITAGCGHGPQLKCIRHYIDKECPGKN